MAKQVTSGKREREKQKEQKRKEKQRRKEQRQSEGTSSFDDMLAYVDKNGVLHASLEEAQAVEEKIDASQIEVSTPKKEEVEEVPLTGKVDFFNASRGFGFVKSNVDGEKYFFHISSAPENITEGDKVTFELERGARGMSAVRMTIIDK